MRRTKRITALFLAGLMALQFPVPAEELISSDADETTFDSVVEDELLSAGQCFSCDPVQNIIPDVETTEEEQEEMADFSEQAAALTEIFDSVSAYDAGESLSGDIAGASEKAGGYWREIKGEYYWVQEDGTILREGCWHVLGGKRYFLANNSGRRKTGWITYCGKKYYLDPQTGVLVTGFARIDGKVYYLIETGKVPGAMKTGFLTLNGNKYFFDEDGAMHTGWLENGGRKYYFGEDGIAVQAWQDIDGARYFFETKTCALHRGGWLTRGKNKYYIKKDGTATIGYVSVNGKKYYMKPKYGIMQTGWMTSGNHKYYFGTDGARVSGFQKVSGNMYYFDPKWGYAATGWRNVGGSRYYFGADGIRRTGLQTIGGKKYAFDTDGKLLTSKPVYNVGGTYCRIDADGIATPFVRRVDILAAQRAESLGYNLQSAFNWAASRQYRTTPQTIPAGYTQAQYYGEYGLVNGYGDCYVMACIFYEMASVLGYKVRFLKGYVPSRSGAVSTHGWVEIYYNGAWRVCDPNFTYNTKRNGFMINYGMSGTWRYINYKVVDQNY